jgi:hypothetical protein
MPHPLHVPDARDARWRPLYRAGAISAIAMLAMMPVQLLVFLRWPPPVSAAGFLQLYERSLPLGLLSLDLLYMVDIALTALLIGALCAALWRESRVLAATALAITLVATGVYFASNPAFSMIAVAQHHATAATDAERAAASGAAESLLAGYLGVANGTSYTLFALGGFLLALAMLRTRIFGKPTGWLGLVTYVLMVVPAGAGRLGMIFAFASLLPLVVWLVLVARRLLRLGRRPTAVELRPQAPAAPHGAHPVAG